VTNRRRGSLLLAAAMAVLVAGMPVAAEAAKRKKKPVLTATVNGKRVKFKFNVQLTGGGDTIAFFVIGQTRPRLGRLLRTLGFSCGLFPPATTPADLGFCLSTYSETRVSRQPSAKAWQTPVGGTRVTVDAWDGSNIAGTFGAVLESYTGDPPVTVEGQFRGRVTLTP
jgi:hypothetical protein